LLEPYLGVSRKDALHERLGPTRAPTVNCTESHWPTTNTGFFGTYVGVQRHPAVGDFSIFFCEYAGSGDLDQILDIDRGPDKAWHKFPDANLHGGLDPMEGADVKLHWGNSAVLIFEILAAVSQGIQKNLRVSNRSPGMDELPEKMVSLFSLSQVRSPYSQRTLASGLWGNWTFRTNSK